MSEEYGILCFVASELRQAVEALRRQGCNDDFVRKELSILVDSSINTVYKLETKTETNCEEK